MSTSKELKQYVKEERFYKAVVEDGADIIFVVNYLGEILYHNPSVEDTLGHPPSSLKGHNFFDYIKPETQVDLKAKFFDCINKPYAESIEFRFRKNDNTYSYLEFNSVNLKHKEGLDGLILDCRDITQRIKDAEELLRAQKTKEQFLANMSHEIRTPINGIAGMVTLLFETEITEQQRKYLDTKKNSSDNLKVIINDILDLSVIESGKLKLEKIGFNLKYQLQHLVDTFKFQANEKGIELEYELNHSHDIIILGDPVRLNQILINLISNAIKFTHEGGIQIKVECKEKDDKYIEIIFNVTDTGIGISQSKLSTIFESFSQADETVTRRFGGTGLGLSISKQLVELQNGSITVNSKENIGTTFTFKITYEKGTDIDLIQQRENIEVKINKYKKSLSKINVLLVEDNDINRLYVANVLKKWNCKFQIAENGLIATEKVKKESYDIVLMDVQMPVMDGIEATKIIRKIPGSKGKTPIIALTANVIKGDDEKYKAIGMDDYLSKPFQPQDLFSLLLKHTKVVPAEGANSEQIITTKSNSLIDLSYLKKMSGNDTDFINSMIELFLEQSPILIDSLKLHLKNKNWIELKKTAHKSKPSMTFFGLLKLKDILSELENSDLDTTDTSKVSDLISIVEKDLKNVIEELKALPL